jgi:hypothetical protein
MLWLAFSIVAALVAVDPAAAADPPPDPSDSALAQYVEQIPTSSGPKAVSQADSQAAGGPLPAAAESELRAEGGDDAQLLEEVATSPSLGAPAHEPRNRASAQKGAPTSKSTGPEAVGASESTASELVSARVIGLLAVLGGVTLAAALFAASRRRSAGD